MNLLSNMEVISLIFGSGCAQIVENTSHEEEFKAPSVNETCEKSDSSTPSSNCESFDDLHRKGNWRESCENVVEINKYALKENILTDVMFVVGPEKHYFHAHRLILALGSPVFEAMFYGPLAEKGSTVTIPDLTADGFYNLLRSVYANDPIFNNYETAYQTYLAADKYCIKHLKIKCEDYICKRELLPSTIWKVLDVAIFLNCTAIKEHCLKYLKANAAAAVEHDSFLAATDTCAEFLWKLIT